MTMPYKEEVMYAKEKAKINHYEDIVSDMIRTLREQQAEIERLSRENEELKRRCGVSENEVPN